MKKLFFLLFILLIVSCVQKNDRTIVQGSNKREYEVIEIDGCEYIYGKHRLAHKGNCKYCKKEGW